jgi:SAM-dependent methyltransferase
VEDEKKSSVAYGGGFLRKLRPRHVATVIANELRMRFSSLIIPRLAIAQKKFLLWGVPTDYFLHRYNTTWRNERAVEMAAVSAFLAENQHGSLLEFGHVIRHYDIGHPDVIVDLYEKGDRVTNIDIVDFAMSTKFDLIVSISTIEHVGWDEWPRSETKTRDALERLTSFLGPNGKLFITAPTGHNPYLDDIIRQGIPNTLRQVFYVREGFEWSPRDNFISLPYGSKGPGAATLWIAEIGPS